MKYKCQFLAKYRIFRPENAKITSNYFAVSGKMSIFAR